MNKIVDLLLKYKTYNKEIRILEPSSGTGNFIKALKEMGFSNIDGCEIDKELTKNPLDFFDMSFNKKSGRDCSGRKSNGAIIWRNKS